MARHKLLSKRNISLLTALIVCVITLVQQRGWLSNAHQTAVQSQPGLYSINHFIDGDTIAVNMNGHTETVRLIGVDTPETHKPNTPVQCYGPAAAAYTKSTIGAGKVRLESDPTNQDRDRYGRLLRYVYLQDGRLLDQELVANGYGFAYTYFPFQKKAEFVAAEADAKQNSRGLWGNCTVHTESGGREQTNNANST